MTAPPRPRPTPQQQRAADPASSIWVTASAGTGKTRVLADRVLRLLLGGAAPERILCITFTKAAAAEMIQRIEASLGSWAVEADDALLAGDIERLCGAPADATQLRRARRLFARVLDLPSGMAIMTIHAFCQSLLRRFPLEADVPPHFEVIDERTAGELLREALERILRIAPGNDRLAGHLDLLAVSLSETSLGEALGQVLGARLRLAALKQRHGGLEGVLREISATLEINHGSSVHDVIEAACGDDAIDITALRRAALALQQGSASDQERGGALAAWLGSSTADRVDSFADYQGIWLTGKGGPRKTLMTKGLGSAHPDLVDALASEQERIVKVNEQLRKVGTAARTAALLTIADAVIDAFENLKQRAAQLDFDDLIERTVALFAQPDLAPWVLYKLDGGLDHLLLDEAQDTSPIQWRVVTALIDEFLAGKGAGDARRSIFVVGDEKQSIYSFQGADVATFARLRRELAERASDAGQPWREETLDLSFRSTEAVLATVDAVFADPEAHQGVAVDGSRIEHRTMRGGQAGIVELWPLVEHQEVSAPIEPWAPPTERQHKDDPPRRVARAIAQRIKSWLNDGTLLEAEGRPIAAGDVLILLPRRGSFQEEMIRALKRAHVPVAGTDRMALAEQIAVMDLMALGDVLLLPDDDLGLACVLKSPLFGLSEDDLFALAHDRGARSLFDELRSRREESDVFGRAFERLSNLMARADFMPPFELYAHLLGAGGGRRRLIERLGPDAAEPIEAFLAQALAYERGHPSSLQSFLHWLRIDATTLKRDAEQARGEVRVMTVHGAKGLEAPIVFLPDTTYLPDLGRERLVWLKEQGLPLWKAKESERDEQGANAIEAMRQAKLEEHRRLLYVALTRARDRLIVCGWAPRRNSSEPHWYDLVNRGLASLPDAEAVEIDAGAGLRGPGLRLALRQSAPLPSNPELAGATSLQSPPNWLERPAPAETAADTATPSRLTGSDLPPQSPLGSDGGHAMLLGRVIHRLLQMLPDLPGPRREDVMERFLGRPALAALGDDERSAIAAQVNGILKAPELAGLFEPGARAEQPIAGIVGGRSMSGQIDRLVVRDDAVLIADFKSGRQSSGKDGKIPIAYVRQMAAYRALLRPIYPDRPIRCFVVWTLGPTIICLDDALLDAQIPVSFGIDNIERPTTGEA